MKRRITSSIAALLAGIAISWGSLANAQPMTIEPFKAWSGRLPLDERPPLQSSIAKDSDWARIWKQCRVQGPSPKVDFHKTLGLVAVRRGSLVKFMNMSVEDGNLKTNVVVTPDMPDYMSCAIVLIDRSGIKKVNGNPVGQ
jgi:hypothetical protein